MDEAFRVEVRNLKKLPDIVTTQDAIILHRLMTEVLQARSFKINWMLEATYHDDGSPLIVFVEQHLQQVDKDKESRTSAFMATSGAFQNALVDIRGRVQVFRFTYQMPQPGELEEYEDGMGDIRQRRAQPRLITNPVSLDDLPERGATYILRIQE